MKFALIFAAFGVMQILWGWSLGGPGALLVWSGLAWFVVGAGYALLGPRVFGKRPDGRLSVVNSMLLLPFLALNTLLWRAGFRRGVNRGHEIAPGLWLGPRPLPKGLSDDVIAVLDMTAEFTKSGAVGDREYLCVPILDATPPDAATISRLVEWIGERRGAVYVHCAAGNGRSATVVAAVVLARGLAPNAAAAVEFVRRIRPSVRPTRAQLQALQEFEHAWRARPKT